jgi:hypothetical protein
MEDEVGVREFFVRFVELGELDPDLGAIPKGLQRINGLDRLGECLNDKESVVLTELDSIQPLVDVVGVLSQNNVRQQERTTLNQSFNPLELCFNWVLTLFLRFILLIDFSRCLRVLSLLDLLVF